MSAIFLPSASTAPVPPNKSLSDVMSAEEIRAMEAFVEATYVRSNERGSGPDTIFVNGGPYMDIYGWEQLTGFPIPGTLYTYAQLDTGLTVLPPGYESTLDNLVLQYTGMILKTYQPGVPLRVMTHSFGGVLARLAHERYLSKLDLPYRLVLIDPIPFTLAALIACNTRIAVIEEERGVVGKMKELTTAYQKVDDQAIRDGLSNEILRLLLPPFLVQQQVLPSVLPEDPKNWNPIGANTITKELMYRGAFDWALGGWPEDSYLVYGTQDPANIGPIPALAGPMIEIADAGHFSPWEQPDAFWAQVGPILM